MITAERKPFEEIYEFARKYKKVLIMGCGSCVTVCLAGGEKEVSVLASQIKLAAKEKGDTISVTEHTITRQCDREFFDEETAKKIKEADAVISIACGVGVQFCIECFPDMIVSPGLNTSCYGATIEQGVWAERCAGCGKCILDSTGGICPVARCAKNLLNGPCGGSQDGQCEVDNELDCAWQLIFDRMKSLNRLSELETIQKPKDWSASLSGGPRKIVREDMKLS
ncbi:methylenetetrahydrofolate reductase C-terminal domain-containing protein [Verrucomicrobiota bacterium]